MIFLHKIKDHNKHKNKLLNLINKVPKDNKSDFGPDSIYKSDFYSGKEKRFEYLDYFFKIIDPIMLQVCDKLFSTNYVIHNAWFQQYKNNNFHKWHTHTKTQFSNIYFLELPDQKLLTEFYNIKVSNIEEGDVITFPSYIFHRSPVNNTNKRKTVVAFNSCFYNFKDIKMSN